jgi:hypothetical protein
MAGFPTQKIVKFVKTYYLELYSVLGIYAFYKYHSSFNNTYRQVYSKNDYERRTHLKALESYIDDHKKA